MSGMVSSKSGATSIHWPKLINGAGPHVGGGTVVVLGCSVEAVVDVLLSPSLVELSMACSQVGEGVHMHMPSEVAH